MSKPKQKTTATCYHCGEDCIETTLHYDDHTFCCQGCKTVYDLLNQTGLTTYYDIEDEAPGKTIKRDHSERDFLDLEEVKERYISFKEGSQNKVTLYLPSMHCAACIWLLERLGRINKGVQKSEINFLKKELTVFFDADTLSLKDLVILLEDLGYPPDLQRNLDQSKSKNPDRKSLLLKLGVAGFAFGNIMLFSFPEYLSLQDASLDSFKGLFNYLNLFLALPVLFYSDVDYLKSAWKSLKVGFLTIDVPIALGILALFIRSAFEILSGTGAGYFDSFAGLVFFLLIGKWYQSRTYEALAFDRDFKSYFPIAVARVQNGEEDVCMLEEIKVGDRLRILNNQVIPADSKLVKGIGAVDYSFVNGESDIIEKKEGDLLYAGGRQTSGSIEVEVVKEVSQSYLTGLWNQSAFTKTEDDTRFSGLIDTFSQYFSVGILLIAFGTLGVRWAFDLGEAFNAFTAVLIIACPCALALSMPFAMGNVSRILGKLGFFVKNTRSLEEMAGADTVVFDKTGTLTNARHTKVIFHGETLSSDDLQRIKSASSNSTHPLSVAIRNTIHGVAVVDLDAFEDIPGTGIKARIGNDEIAMGSARLADIVRPVRANLNHSLVHVWINRRHLGYYAIEKELRPGISELVSSLKPTYETYLTSGDNEGEKDKMVDLLGTDENLLFRQSPQDKLDLIHSLKSTGKRVLMLGDGLNDAGALKASNVGVAVADDVFSFSPSCDAILQADRLKDLGRFLIYIKKSLNVVKVSIVISLLYNAVGLFFAIAGELTPVFAAILMPLSSVTVVGFVSLLTTLFRPRD